MAYIIEGKIGGFFPNAGDDAIKDIHEIVFIPPGSTDMYQVNEVYYVPPGETPTLQNILDYRFWYRYERTGTLSEGNANQVAIEFTPKSEFNVEKIGIFTSQGDGTDGTKVKIIHESGLFVAAVDSATRYEQITLYGTSGYRRVADFTGKNVKLYPGLKYYIVFTRGSGSWAPAHFTNLNTGLYKFYSNDKDSNNTKNIQDYTDTRMDLIGTVLDPYKCYGVMSDSSRIFSLPEGAWFVWNNSQQQTGLTVGHVYVRTSVGADYTFTGIIGDPTSYYEPLNSTYLGQFLSRQVDQEFIWYVTNTSLTRGDIYVKSTSTNSLGRVELENVTDDNDKFGILLNTIYNTNGKVIIASGSIFNSSNTLGSTYELKSGYTSQASSATRLYSLPSNPVEKGLYYLDGSCGQAIGHNTGIFAYENGSYNRIDGNNIENYANVGSYTNYATRVGSNQDFLTGNYYGNDNENFVTLVDQTGNPRTYYLEINGYEVK